MSFLIAVMEDPSWTEYGLLAAATYFVVTHFTRWWINREKSQTEQGIKEKKALAARVDRAEERDGERMERLENKLDAQDIYQKNTLAVKLEETTVALTRNTEGLDECKTVIEDNSTVIEQNSVILGAMLKRLENDPQYTGTDTVTIPKPKL